MIYAVVVQSKSVICTLPAFQSEPHSRSHVREEFSEDNLCCTNDVQNSSIAPLNESWIEDAFSLSKTCNSRVFLDNALHFAEPETRRSRMIVVGSFIDLLDPEGILGVEK